MARRKRKPLSAEPFSAQIDDLSHDGRGVARIDGKVTFVRGALAGETVTARLVERRRDFDVAETLEVVNASPHRVEPRCPHFGSGQMHCGGCVLQHLAPEHQIGSKQQTLLDNLQRIGGVTPDRVLPPLVAGQWAYRRRARLGVKWVPKKGKVLVGFRERGGRFIADLHQCDVLAPPIGELIPALSMLVGELSIRDRLPQIEVAIGDQAVVLLLRHLAPLTPDDTIKLRHFATQHEIVFYLQPKGLDSIHPLDEAVELRYGLTDQGLEFRFEPAGFVQVNAELNQAMINLALEKMELDSADRVLDLFCGLGNFTLPIAQCAAAVVGVEGDAGLIALAKENARRNSINNAQFFVADLAEQRQTLQEFGQLHYNKVLLDPARSGAEHAIPALVSNRPERIVYVSCHPGSLARDAGLLVKAHGYRLVEAGVMDMFPHTAHVESIAVFEDLQ